MVNSKGSGNVEITQNNIQSALNALDNDIEQILTTIGIKAEKYAKALCPVGTPESTGKKGYRGGTLRNSITHGVEIDKDGGTLSVGTNVEYAPYVELGTGPYFTPPPEWEQFDAPQGSGIGHGYVRPRKFLEPAITDHLDEYKKIIESHLKG